MSCGCAERREKIDKALDEAITAAKGVAVAITAFIGEKPKEEAYVPKN